jgi:lipopolysaccharide transport system ATP-binding protein
MVELCKQGRALLFVSHAPSAVQMMCDRAIWLDGGSIRAMGDVGEIVQAYEADFRRQEDESNRSGNTERRDARLGKLLPDELLRKELARVRLTGPTNRITDTHYVRSVQIQTEDGAQEIPLGYGDMADDGTIAALDVSRSEWGRPHTRRGVETRTLQPSSHPLRGGHLLLRRPREGEPERPFRLVVESTSLSTQEPLKAQVADPRVGEWVDLDLAERERLDRNWERAVFAGVLTPTDAERHAALLESIIEESRPDVEIVGARMLAEGKETTRVRERSPFAIEITIRANHEVPAADVALKLLKSDGTYVFWQSSGQGGGNLHDLIGVKLVTFLFDPNVIGAGEYELTVEVQNGFDIERNWPYSQVYDRRVGILRFTIEREWALLMLGPLNYRFPVKIEDARQTDSSSLEADGT